MGHANAVDRGPLAKRGKSASFHLLRDEEANARRAGVTNGILTELP